MKKTFTKEERLCSKRKIDSLFHSGSSFIIYPFRVVYLKEQSPDCTFSVKVIISVSKRRFRRAHDRNRIKRLMREVYRLQKNELLYQEVAKSSLNLSLAIQFVGKEETSFELMYQKMSKVLKQLADAISN